jgi:hypothetical protein
MSVHGVLEFFRPEHGHNEIRAERTRDDAQNEIFHKVRLQFFAAARVKHESGKEQHH